MNPKIKLKIKEAGHIILIPGLPEFRTPADVDITKINIRSVIVSLKNSGVDDFSIVSKTGDMEHIYTKKDFGTLEKDQFSEKTNGLEKRFSKLESILNHLLTKKDGNERLSEEQIINKLDKLEELFLKNLRSPVVVREKDALVKGEPVIEELDAFIPEIEIGDMKISSSDNIKVVKQEEDAERSAAALADLISK